jgi:hypothetical protein
MFFTGKEPLHRELQERGRLAQLDRWPNLDLVVMGTSADTHTLTPVWLQRQVNELIDRRLRGELAPPGPSPSAIHSSSPSSADAGPVDP